MGVFSGGMGAIGQDFLEISGGGGVLLKLALFLFVWWTRQG